VRGLLFHPDGARLVSASLDGLLRVWSLPTLSPVASMLGHGSEVSDVALDPVTGGLLSVDALGRVKAWRWDADDVRRWRGPAGWYMGLDVSPDGERLVTTGWTTKEQGTATVEVREVSSGALLWSRALDGTNCTGAAFSPDGTRIAVTAAPPSLRILDADTGEELAASELEGAREALSLCWTPDGSTLLTCGSGVGVVLHEARGLAPIGRYESGAGRCTTVAMHPGGALFLAARRPDAAELVDARSLEVLAVLRGHEGNITSADFSPSGDLVATGSRDGTVRLWSVPGGVELAVLRGHSSWPTDVAFSPDGRRLASVSEDHTVRLWSMPDGRELATLRGHRALVRAALFAPDGSYLATLSVDGELRIWDAPHLAE
jgi:WD40 repeat protein